MDGGLSHHIMDINLIGMKTRRRNRARTAKSLRSPSCHIIIPIYRIDRSNPTDTQQNDLLFLHSEISNPDIGDTFSLGGKATSAWTGWLIRFVIISLLLFTVNLQSGEIVSPSMAYPDHVHPIL